MIEGVRHIIFDLGNVLLNINPELTYKALADLNIPQFESVYQSLCAEQVFERFETNELNARQFLDQLKQASGIALSDKELIDAWNALLLDFPVRRLQILQQLRLYHDLVLLSNTNAIHEDRFNQILQQQHSIPNIGVFFDKVYLSHRVGMRKPNPALFARVLDECGFKAENTLFIDDVAENVAAAASLGIQTIWLETHMRIEEHIFLNRTK
jgi:FMN phosphatase YigB (HAD superfamily)